MSANPQKQWEFEWQEPTVYVSHSTITSQGPNGYIHKQLSIENLNISLDPYINHTMYGTLYNSHEGYNLHSSLNYQESISSNQLSTLSDKSSATASTNLNEESFDRQFYPPLLSKLSFKIRMKIALYPHGQYYDGGLLGYCILQWKGLMVSQ